MIGGDSLEENFLIGSSDSEAFSDTENDSGDSVRSSRSNSASSDESLDDGSMDERSEEKPVKKLKLNWRETASDATGSPESQRNILERSLSAFERFFPNTQAPFKVCDLDSLKFIDCADFLENGTRAFGDLLSYLSNHSNGFSAKALTGLKTIIITGSATRAMFLVREVREMNKDLSPLPLFFHGGGRKKEQTRTHESVLRANKSSVVVTLPSRLKAVLEGSLIDLKTVTLILVDLKHNEKRLNVLSQKDTMLDLLQIIGSHIIPNAGIGMQLVLI